MLLESWSDPLTTLRKKWGEVPGTKFERQQSRDLLALPDAQVSAQWQANRDSWDFLWYHEAYRRVVQGKRLLDIGCGFGVTTPTFAEFGARVTFTDIVESNVELMRQLCRARGIEADFLYIDSLDAYDRLGEFDMVTSLGSLHHQPFANTVAEVARISPHLRTGGRWLHLTYPRTRWEREGSPAFSKWGTMTDGETTPWAEWHDLDKVRAMLAPREIRVLHDCEFHNADFNWFDVEITN